MTELKRARKRYEGVTWDNTGDETAKTVRESLKLNKLDSVSRYDLLVSYQKWKELKNITTPQNLAIEAKKINISQATCYNLFEFLKTSGIADFKNNWK